MYLNNIISKTYSNIFFPFYHFIKRDGLWEIIKEYEHSQWYPFDKLLEIQQKKLKLLMQHAQQHVPYYSKLFKKVGYNSNGNIDFKRISLIPFLTKNIINENRNSLISLHTQKKDLVANSTSGSTGEGLYFFQDKKATLCRQAVVWRNQQWVNCIYADRQAFLWGAPLDLADSQSIRGRIHSYFNRGISLSSYELSDEFMHRYVKILNTYKPKLFVSYPSPLTTFSEFLIANSYKIPSVYSVITSAETLYSWQRPIIEKAFSCPVFDRYGSREFGNIAHECDKHQGYHVNIERFYLEFINDKGEPAQEGESGEIVVTDLDNYGFPFIRYRIEDVAIPTSKLCSCGRGLPLVKRIEGRTFDIIKGINGNNVAGTYWTLTLRVIPGIRNFQVEQTSTLNLIIRIVTSHDYSKASEKKIIADVREKCGKQMMVEFSYVDEIPLTKSGKRKFVISNIQ